MTLEEALVKLKSSNCLKRLNLSSRREYIGDGGFQASAGASKSENYPSQ